jgi:hypothetical protein
VLPWTRDGQSCACDQRDFFLGRCVGPLIAIIVAASLAFGVRFF